MSEIKEHSETAEIQETTAHATPRWMGLAVAALAAVSVLSLGIGWSAANRAGNVEQSLIARASTQDQTTTLLSKRLSQAEDTNAQLKGELSVVTDRLKLTQGELSRARKQTKEFKAAYSQQLSDVENSVKTELATKASSDDVNSKVGAINGDIAGVRSDLDSAKQNLQMARGEFGTLIARNHEEIEQLRRSGQRDYYEFTIAKKGDKQKLGNSVTVELRGTNVKKSLY
ncbi:MAG: hypothetical protein HY046_02105, partial [Acidobacteria bacterium]|nr:hypothetical protein [Acidobacteriota bacterium]